MSILEVDHVSVRYITGDFKDIGLKEFVVRKLKRDYHVQEFWADRDINFKLEKGDMLGIIGTNGAGKSTLLKAVSGIMEPTHGVVRREGTIAALLELASGFDGDLTVRENTYLRGAMLGYTRKFMDEMYQQIIDFAELREFENRPFKQLSSGMKSRLAFSIASLVQPDILILDEVLSVGDGAFRRKSEVKMREILSSGSHQHSGVPLAGADTGAMQQGAVAPQGAGRSPSAMTCRTSATGMRTSSPEESNCKSIQNRQAHLCLPVFAPCGKDCYRFFS